MKTAQIQACFPSKAKVHKTCLCLFAKLKIESHDPSLKQQKRQNYAFSVEPLPLGHRDGRGLI
jgi:hypothetical protein